MQKLFAKCRCGQDSLWQVNRINKYFLSVFYTKELSVLGLEDPEMCEQVTQSSTHESLRDVKQGNIYPIQGVLSFIHSNICGHLKTCQLN